MNDEPRPDRALQNARDCQHLSHLPSGKCLGCGEQHQPLPGYQEGDDDAALRECAADAREWVAREKSAWDGPFRVSAEVVTAQDGEGPRFIQVSDAKGAAFVYVCDDTCVGGLPGAKARATRIAEALNAQHDQVTVTVKGRDLAEAVRAVVRHEIEALNRRRI